MAALAAIQSPGIAFRSAAMIPFPIRILSVQLSVSHSIPGASPAQQSKLALWGPHFWEQLPEPGALSLCFALYVLGDFFWQLDGLCAHSAVLGWALSSYFSL